MITPPTPFICPVAYTLKLIGGKYKPLILWHLKGHVLRFGQLRKILPQATPKMLTQQLRELEADQLLTRKVYPEVPPKVEYRLTALGESLYPILEQMYDWGSASLIDQGVNPNCSMRHNPQSAS